MIHKLLTLICFFSMTLSAFAQHNVGGKISGTVRTADGQPAGFITVYLKGTQYGAVTDAKGDYSFRAPVGLYTMVVSSVATHTQEFQIEVKAGENKIPVVTIVERSIELDVVVVTGQLVPQSLRNSVYRVRVIDNERIQAKAANDVPSLLNTEIGIRLMNDLQLGETDFELMGMSGNDVKVLIDGVPVVDRDAKRQSLSQIDVNSIARVEIVEGPMSVLYGSDAIAGVINIITRKASPSPDKDSWTVSAGVREESAGREYAFGNGKGLHRQNVQLGWAGKKGLYAGTGFTRNSYGGWRGDSTGRAVVSQPRDQYMYNGTVGYSSGGFNAWYRIDFLDEKIVTPENISQARPEQVSDKSFLTDRLNHQLQADWRINNRMRVNLAASYQDYERRTRTIFTNVSTGERKVSAVAGDQDTSRVDMFFVRAAATWLAAPKLTVQPGMEYQWQKASGDRILGEPTLNDVAAYVSAEWRPLDWANIRPGVRAILNSDYDAPLAIPALLTKFSLTSDMDLRASYAYGFRAPALRELYFYYYNPNHRIDGNPDLRAEYSHNVSLSYTWRILHEDNVRLTSTVSGFYNDFNDRITYIADADDPTHYVYHNVDRHKTTGGTLENTVAWRNLRADVGVSIIGSYNSFADDERFTDRNLPMFKFSPEVTASITYKFTGTEIALFYKYTGKREKYIYNARTNVLSRGGMDGFHWADLTISRKVGKYIQIQAGVKNIFNVTTLENTAAEVGHASNSTSALIGVGTSYFVGMNFNFGR